MNKKSLCMAFLAAPIILYFTLIMLNSVNIPIYDDIETILGFLARLNQAGSVGDVVTLFLRADADHIIGMTRVMALGDRILAGQVNFIHLIVGGNLFLLALYMAISVAFRERDVDRWMLFLPVSFLLFQIQYWEISTWAVAATTYFAVFFLALLSLLFLQRESTMGLVCAIASAILACLTAANGMFVFLAGMPLLLFRHRYVALSIWTMAAVVLIFVFFFFQGTGGNASGTNIAASIIRSLSDPTILLVNILSSMGSTLGFGLKLPSVVAGSFIAACLVYVAYKKYYALNPVFFLFIVFLLMTCAAVALKRSLYGTDLILFTSRYRLISTILTVCTYIALVETMKTGEGAANFARKALVFSIVFMVVSNIAYLPFLSGRCQELKSGENGILHNNPTFAMEVLRSAKDSGLYRLPAGYLERGDARIARTPEGKLNRFASVFNNRTPRDTTLTIRLNLPWDNPWNGTLSCLLQKPSVIYLFGSGSTPTTVRAGIHDVDPDQYHQNLVIRREDER